MPSKLIKQLRNLMEMDLGAEEPSRETRLGVNGPILSDEVLEVIDDVAATARAVFGPKLEPTSIQQTALHACGFPVTCGERDHIGWKIGVIQTPKGQIAYY